jgi:hypothetical protein
MQDQAWIRLDQLAELRTTDADISGNDRVARAPEPETNGVLQLCFGRHIYIEPDL